MPAPVAEGEQLVDEVVTRGGICLAGGRRPHAATHRRCNRL